MGYNIIRGCISALSENLSSELLLALIKKVTSERFAAPNASVTMGQISVCPIVVGVSLWII